MSKKPHSKPAWWKNTYFWLAAFLFVIGVVGLPFVAGEEAIRDPGQRRESGLAILYFVAAGVMVVNGWISHTLTVKHYREEAGEE